MSFFRFIFFIIVYVSIHPHQGATAVPDSEKNNQLRQFLHLCFQSKLTKAIAIIACVALIAEIINKNEQNKENKKNKETEDQNNNNENNKLKMISEELKKKIEKINDLENKIEKLTNNFNNLNTRMETIEEHTITVETHNSELEKINKILKNEFVNNNLFQKEITSKIEDKLEENNKIKEEEIEALKKENAENKQNIAKLMIQIAQMESNSTLNISLSENEGNFDSNTLSPDFNQVLYQSPRKKNLKEKEEENLLYSEKYCNDSTPENPGQFTFNNSNNSPFKSSIEESSPLDFKSPSNNNLFNNELRQANSIHYSTDQNSPLDSGFNYETFLNQGNYTTPWHGKENENLLESQRSNKSSESNNKNHILDVNNFEKLFKDKYDSHARSYTTLSLEEEEKEEENSLQKYIKKEENELTKTTTSHQSNSLKRNIQYYSEIKKNSVNDKDLSKQEIHAFSFE